MLSHSLRYIAKGPYGPFFMSRNLIVPHFYYLTEGHSELLQVLSHIEKT